MVSDRLISEWAPDPVSNWTTSADRDTIAETLRRQREQLPLPATAGGAEIGGDKSEYR